MSEEKKPKIEDLPEKPVSPEETEAVKGGFAPGGGGKKQTKYDPGEADPTTSPTPSPSPTPTPTPPR